MYFYSHSGTPTNVLYKSPCSVLSKDFSVRHFQSKLELHSSDDSIPGPETFWKTRSTFSGGVLPLVMNLSARIPLCRCLSAVPISKSWRSLCQEGEERPGQGLGGITCLQEHRELSLFGEAIILVVPSFRGPLLLASQRIEGMQQQSLVSPCLRLLARLGLV
jgi:hypothetical protein